MGVDRGCDKVTPPTDKSVTCTMTAMTANAMTATAATVKNAPWMRADWSKFSAMNLPNRLELSLRTCRAGEIGRYQYCKVCVSSI